MIELEQITDPLVNAFQAQPIVSVGILLVFGILLVWKPKVILKMIALVIAIALVIYIMSLIFDTLNLGFSEKEKLYHKEP